MMYIDDIRNIAKKRVLTAADIIKTCQKLTPEYRQARELYNSLDHGRAILGNEDQLNAYMKYYGDAHMQKAMKALDALPRRELNNGIEVIDYGCGQALASMCLIEKMREWGNLHLLRIITLIEPSTIALDRAVMNLQTVLGTVDCGIISVSKYLPSTASSSNEIKRLDIVHPIAIHLFSNVLDIESIDLKSLARLVSSSGYRHYVVCVGPASCRDERIESFCEHFESQEVRSLMRFRESQFCRPSSTNHTFGCLINAFTFTVVEGKSVVKQYKYYAPKQLTVAYQLDEISGWTSEDDVSNEKMTCDVFAPFDICASIYEDVHPVLAVLSNIISRGIPTKASPFIEETMRNLLGYSTVDNTLGGIKYVVSEEQTIKEHDLELMKYVPTAVARIEKTVIEAMIIKRLPMKSSSWNVLVKEDDVPCAALAFSELRDMFNHLTAMTEQYSDLQFPKINLTIINSRHTISPLHLGNTVLQSADYSCSVIEYDLVIDISMKQYCDPTTVTFPVFRANNNCYFVIRPSQSPRHDRTFYTTDRIVYKPFTQRNDAGTYNRIDETAVHLRYFLQLLFRKQEFKDGQLPILTRALQQKSVIGLLPTGGGKSLTYQLAALLQPGVTLIVDPLISLMKDQYDGLIANGINCCSYINSRVPTEENRKREKLLKESKLLMLFLSPERLSIMRFRETLKAMSDAYVYFAYGVIDEVHCVSEWGHDFRFSYLHLGRNLYSYVLPKQTNNSELNHITLFGLTATASFDVLADVERELSGNNAFPLDTDAIVRYENTNRLELQYKVIHVNVDTSDKWKVFKKKNSMVCVDVIRQCRGYLQELLGSESVKNIKERFIERENIRDEKRLKQIRNTDLSVDIPEEWYASKNNEGAMIVFCPHRNGSLGVKNGVAKTISNGLHVKVSEFVGGIDLSVQDEFIHGRSNIIVATEAFGMGIDKPNVRFTINMNYPDSLEGFVQEAGRAGRDGKMALAVILYCDTMISEQNKNTRLYESMTADYSVQNYFFNQNFKGKDVEKYVMYYLMASQSINIIEETKQRSVSGFLREFDKVDVGGRFIFYISYRSPSDDSQKLDEILRMHKLQPISQPQKRGDDEYIDAQFIDYYPISKPHKRGDDERNSKKKNNDNDAYYTALSKAIYRMCCIGVIEDYTQDYVNETFRIVACKRPDGEYYEHLKHFLTRYYSEERAARETKRAMTYKGDNEIQRCLGFLTEFVYNNIAAKRKKAIDDIQLFCEDAVANNENNKKSWLDTNEDLKDFIYFYFNSKYARDGYTVNGEPFSLTEDTDRGKLSSFDILFKYMRVVDDDMLEDGATPKDNIRHLQGAVRLINRTTTEPNPTLCLLNVFCILFLDIQNNKNMRKGFVKSYIEGYKGFHKATADKAFFYSKMDDFRNELRKRNISGDAIDKLHSMDVKIEVTISSAWIMDFSKQYIK